MVARAASVLRPIREQLGANGASRALELYCSLVAKAAIDGIARSSTAHGADLGAADVAPEEPALAAEEPVAEGELKN